MSESPEYPVTQEAFRAWLEGQPKRRVVGHACTNRACPIAIYFRDVLGDYVMISNDQTEIDAAWWPNPAWVEAFTREIDRSRTEWDGVTAMTCLKALDRIALDRPE